MKKEKQTEEKKQNIKLKKEKAAMNKRIKELNFEDFKKTFVVIMDELEKVLCKAMKSNRAERDQSLKLIGKEIKLIYKQFDCAEINFKTLDDRLHALEGFTAIMAIKTKEALLRKHLTYEERKEIAHMVSIKWDKSDNDIFDKAA